MPSIPWASIVIHPQSGSICYAYRAPDIWPESGFPYFIKGTEQAKPWPVPWIKGARLVDCHCGKTGLQPRTHEDIVRYTPGTKLEGDRIVFQPLLEVTYTLPDGSGRDEETVSEAMLERALLVLEAAGWSGPHVSKVVMTVASDPPTEYERLKHQAAVQSAADGAARKNRELVRAAIRAALSFQEQKKDC